MNPKTVESGPGQDALSMAMAALLVLLVMREILGISAADAKTLWDAGRSPFEWFDHIPPMLTPP